MTKIALQLQIRWEQSAARGKRKTRHGEATSHTQLEKFFELAKFCKKMLVKLRPATQLIGGFSSDVCTICCGVFKCFVLHQIMFP